MYEDENSMAMAMSKKDKMAPRKGRIWDKKKLKSMTFDGID